MSELPDLHARLMALQSDEELERKAAKAVSKSAWTQEDIDAADRKAERLHAAIHWE